MSRPILAPVIVLVLWSFVMWAWLYATRLPAMARLKLVYDPTRPATLGDRLMVLGVALVGVGLILLPLVLLGLLMRALLAHAS